jgi:hypothetical protein
MAVDAIYVGNEVDQQIVYYRGQFRVNAGAIAGATLNNQVTVTYTGLGNYLLTLHDPGGYGRAMEITGVQLTPITTLIADCIKSGVVGVINNAARSVQILATADNHVAVPVAGDPTNNDGWSYMITTRRSIAAQ